MWIHLRPAVMLTLFFTLLTGLAYPLAMTGAATIIAPSQAEGSLIRKNGQIIGSSLIGQNVTSDNYFHPRPSATSDGLILMPFWQSHAGRAKAA